MRLILIPFFTLLLITTSCLRENRDEGLLKKSFSANSHPVAEGELYFDMSLFKDTVKILRVAPPYDTITELEDLPEDASIRFVEEVKIDSFTVENLSEHLYRAKEPVLSKGWRGNEIYRFTWLRSFDQDVIIKLHKEEDEQWMETKWLSDESEVDKVVISQLAKGEIEEFEHLLEETNFWSIPSVEGSEGAVRVDGSTWLMEAHERDQYHFVKRWSPDSGEHAGLRKVGEWLILNSDAANERIY